MPEMTLEEAMQAAMHLDAPQANTNYPELEKAVREFEGDGYNNGPVLNFLCEA